ncbi:MAG: type II methionyl aminopeptidase [Nanoarchaeota archaeon]|nr:type II methionyl aminopeptidase [Nanoarchaeota archaeon]
MTEKHYGGDDGRTKGNLPSTAKKSPKIPPSKDQKNKNTELEKSSMFTKEEIEKLKKAGEITKEVKKYARSFIKKDTPLLEIAEKIEAKIIDLGCLPAFPVNLSINEIAAHATPSFNDTEKAHGLLKVDIGVHIEGFIADTAFSLDLENSEQNKKLIDAAEAALEKATEKINLGVSLNEIGTIIEKTISSYKVIPIQNLSGHSIEIYDLHAGITIPNYSNSSLKTIEPGIYAIEPFTTNGLGIVKDGKPSGIYHLMKEGNVRDNFAREVLQFIKEEYQTLPFCSRWLYKKFGSRALLAIKRIEEAGLLHNYSQLIEKNKGIVAQAEHTVIITEKEKIITT